MDDAWETILYPSRKGEDIDEVHSRAHALLRVLIPTVEHRYNGVHRRILLVSYAATCIALARALVNNSTLPIRFGCGSIMDFKPKDASSNLVGNWEATNLADGAHLKEGASRDWGFEDAVIVDGKVRRIAVESVYDSVFTVFRSRTMAASPALRMRRMSQLGSKSNSSHLTSGHNSIRLMLITFRARGLMAILIMIHRGTVHSQVKSTISALVSIALLVFI